MQHFFREASVCNDSVSLVNALTPLLQEITNKLYQKIKTKKTFNFYEAVTFYEGLTGRKQKNENYQRAFLEMAVQVGLSKNKVKIESWFFQVRVG
jgi:hypothetical protein